jgi:hypothetical protein
LRSFPDAHAHFAHGAPPDTGKAVLRKVLAKESTVAKFNDLQAVKKIEMLRKRAKMTDFDRFRVFVAKRQV